VIDALVGDADGKDVIVLDDEIANGATIIEPPEKRLPNMTILSIAPLLAETIRRSHVRKSVSELFEV
jgi:ribose-phosphate pyrophosphokinase